MKDMKITFNQLASGIICVLCLAVLACIYFFPSKGMSQYTGEIVLAFVVAFKEFSSFITGTNSSSQAKDEAAKQTSDKLVDALKESTPTTQIAQEIKNQ